MNIQKIIQPLKKYPIAAISAAILIIMLAVLFLRGGIVPELQQVESDLTAKVRIMDKNALHAQGLEADLKVLNERVQEIPKFLFVPSERALNTNYFYALEDQVDVLITDVKQVSNSDPVLSAKGPHELKLYSVLVYEVNFKLTFYNFLKLLHAIHTTDRLMKVTAFQLTESKAIGAQNDTLAARVRIVVLAQK